MTQLKKFTFDIYTSVYRFDAETGLQSNENIQRSFVGRDYQEMISNVNIIQPNALDRCHICTLPFVFDHFVNLDNSFQGGLFHQVRLLKMFDQKPFEYKQDSSIIITFPYLRYHDLHKAHDDYARQFLSKGKPCLSRVYDLGMMK